MHGSRCKEQGARCRVHGQRFRVHGVRSKVQGLRFKVHGARSKVKGSRQGSLCHQISSSKLFYSSNIIPSYSNNPELKYRSPLSQIIQTIIPDSISCATWRAIVVEPPLLIPAIIPSSTANLLVIATA